MQRETKIEMSIAKIEWHSKFRSCAFTPICMGRKVPPRKASSVEIKVSEMTISAVAFFSFRKAGIGFLYGVVHRPLAGSRWKQLL